jgi:hypothetical protein
MVRLSARNRCSGGKPHAAADANAWTISAEADLGIAVAEEPFLLFHQMLKNNRLTI